MSCFLKELDSTDHRAGFHHGPWSRTMEDGPFQWSEFMVRLLEKKFSFESLGPLTRCKPNVDQEEGMTMHQKTYVLIFFLKQAQEDHFGLHLSSLLCWMYRRRGLQIFSQQYLKRMRWFICTYSMWITCDMYLVFLVLENYAKKNRNRFPIAVLLATLICNH